MTSFFKVYNAFFEKMEADENFFNYFDLSENQVMALARDRAHTYLKEAVSILVRKVGTDDSDFSFSDYDDELEEFNVDLTDDEVDMLACLMYEQEYKRQFSKLKMLAFQHVPSSLQVFSPSNERKTIQALYERIHEDIVTMIDNYMSKDRLTHKRKSLDYSEFSSDD